MKEGNAGRSPEAVLLEIEEQALALMASLGEQHLGTSLLACGWTFGFDRARRRLGCCRWRDGQGPVKRITVSKHFARELGWEGMEPVVRHEIAHALDFETRGRSRHDGVWKAWAVRCGTDPHRRYEGPLPEMDGARYVGQCPACGKRYLFYRRLRRPHACGACCDRYQGGRYSEAYRLVVRAQR